MYTSDVDSAISSADVVIICVNTPATRKTPFTEQLGQQTDLTAFNAVVNTIARVSPAYKIVVNKSTVPINTLHSLEHKLPGKDLVSCPEFLAEGSAIRDLTHPQRVVIGTCSEPCFQVLKHLSPKNCPIVWCQDSSSAELGKLMANAMLAQRVSSINSITELCETT